jgi:L-malate glycosyltransferase
MSRPIQVFHLIKGLGRGGAETLLVEMLRSGSCESVTYAYGYLLPKKDALATDLRAQGAEVSCLASASGMLPLAAPRIAHRLRAWKADILHCHLPLAGAVGRIAGRLAGVPVVYTEHNVMERYHPLTRRANLATWALQRQVIAVSDEVAASASHHAGSRIPIDVVHNGVDVRAFTRDPEAGARVREKLGIDPGATVLGTVAVFREQKRLDLLLEAGDRVLSADPHAHLLIVGDGPLDVPLRQQARSLAVPDRVHFAGRQSDVKPWLSAMDAFVMCSDYEGLPVALLEAMAMECAVLSSRVGGIPEAIQHEQSGLLFESGNTDELAAQAIRLAGDASLRRRLARAARQRVSTQFNIVAMVQRTEGLYRELLRAAQ